MQATAPELGAELHAHRVAANVRAAAAPQPRFVHIEMQLVRIGGASQVRPPVPAAAPQRAEAPPALQNHDRKVHSISST